MLAVSAVPAFQDNYLWMIHDSQHAVVVDPGDANAVAGWLAQRQLKLIAILLTHHHDDHIGGVDALVASTGAKVYGHRADAHRLPGLDVALDAGDTVEVPELSLRFRVLATPGHTLGHICYHAPAHQYNPLSADWLFCGDTLFSGGCGRMFEGNPKQYHDALMQLAALPPATQVFAAHEYTASNFAFASALMPNDAATLAAKAAVSARRTAGLATLPSSIGWERQHNVFLRCHESLVAHAVGLMDGAEPARVFAALRRAKDVFRAT